MRRLILIAAALLVVTGCTAATGKAPQPPATPPSSAPSPSTTAPSTPSPSQPSQPPAQTASPGQCAPSASAAYLGQGSGVTLQRPAVEGTAERPLFLYASLGQIEEAVPGSQLLGETYAIRSGSASAGVAASSLYIWMEPAPPAAWFESHVAITGLEPLSHEWPLARIPAGKAGESFRLTLKDVLQSDGSVGDVVVEFCRQEQPRATLTYKQGDSWQPVPEDGYVPAGPLSLRIGFTRPMDRESVELALRAPLVSSQIDQISWLADQTLELHIADPGSAYPLHVLSARDQLGLYVAGGLPYVYPGEKVRLAAVDPTSGERRQVLELPPQIDGGTLSPDGKQFLLLSTRPRAGYSWSDPRWLLYDLASGGSQSLTPDQLFYWLKNGQRVRQSWEKDHLVLLFYSPDGSQQLSRADLPDPIGGYQVAPNGERLYVLLNDEKNPAPYPYRTYQLSIRTPDGKEVGRLAEPIRLSRPGKDGIELYDPVWSPDSTLIAMTQDQGKEVLVVVADVKTGGLRTIARLTEGLQGRGFDRILWSPDGTRLLVGQLLLDAATGQVLARIPNVAGRSPWSADGQWLLQQAPEAPEVSGYQIATGRSLPLGKGRPVGWSPQGQALLIVNERPFQWLQFNK